MLKLKLFTLLANEEDVRISCQRQMGHFDYNALPLNTLQAFQNKLWEAARSV